MTLLCLSLLLSVISVYSTAPAFPWVFSRCKPRRRPLPETYKKKRKRGETEKKPKRKAISRNQPKKRNI